MGCSNEGPFDGGTYVDPKIVNGTMQGTTLNNVSLTGNVVIDEAVAQRIVDAICPYINKCVELSQEEVAAVFKNCAGAAHVPAATIPTCEEMNDAIAEASIPVIVATTPTTTQVTGDNVLPTVIVGEERTQLLGKPTTYIKMGDYLIPAYKE